MRHFQRDRSQHDHPAARCIAQQYSSATAVSLSSHSREEKHSARVSRLFIIFTLLKPHSTETAELGIALSRVSICM